MSEHAGEGFTETQFFGLAMDMRIGRIARAMIGSIQYLDQHGGSPGLEGYFEEHRVTEHSDVELEQFVVRGETAGAKMLEMSESFVADAVQDVFGADTHPDIYEEAIINFESVLGDYDPDAEFFESFAQLHAREAVDDAAGLTEKQKIVFKFARAGFSLSEVAAAMNIGESATVRLMRRAREKRVESGFPESTKMAMYRRPDPVVVGQTWWLTDDERRIWGHTEPDPDVAEDLGISVHTLRSIRQRAIRKAAAGPRPEQMDPHGRTGQEREALRLLREEGLNQTQIARQMGLSPSGISRMIKRAIEKERDIADGIGP